MFFMNVSQIDKHRSCPNNCDTKPAFVDDIKSLQVSDDTALKREDTWRKRQAVKSVLLGCLTGKTLWYLNQARALNKAKLDITEGEQASWGNSVPNVYSEIEEEIAIREIRASEWQIRVGYANIAMYGIVLVASAWGARTTWLTMVTRSVYFLGCCARQPSISWSGTSNGWLISAVSLRERGRCFLKAMLKSIVYAGKPKILYSLLSFCIR